ncbi:MAG: efflux RND transporter periplasmic adaptor subunit [Ferruginibacter sp.]
MKITSKRLSKTIVPIAVIAIIAGGIFFVLANNKKKINAAAKATPQGVSAMPVRIAAVQIKRVDKAIVLTGTFEARKTLPLTSEAQGSIIQLNIKEGDKVGQGQVIARIDPTAIQSNLSTAQASFNQALKDKDRYQRLLNVGAISQVKFEDITLNVENARANLTGIQQQMKYTIIRSPMSGIINEVKVERGSFATVGMQIGTVVDISKLKMVLKVGEEDVIKLRKAQQVTIQTAVYPEHDFKGNITLISVQADGGKKYDVEVEVSNDINNPLKAGMFGTASLDAQNGDNREKLFIPRKAIIGSIKDAQVFVLNNDSTITRKNIEVQNQSGDEVIVLKGLDDNDHVVITGQINIKEGDKVRVIK